MTYEEQIKDYISNPEKLLMKKPFLRGASSLEGYSSRNGSDGEAEVGQTFRAELPAFAKDIVTQSDFAMELDPNSHKILFDDAVPSITVKSNDGTYVDLEFKKMPVPFQKMIKNKHVLYLCGYGVQFTIDNTDPSEAEKKDFATFKRYWKSRNMDGMRTKLVNTQKSYGDGGLLFYFDRNGQIKARLISYEDGYVICSHNDPNGDRLIESIYYRADGREYIDSFTDTIQYRHVRNLYSENKEETEWNLEFAQPHGFNEIPLVTKRGDVAWNNVQSIIEVYEIIYNIFLVIQKRHGWGILYIKGKFVDKAKKIAGNVVLNDASLNGDGDAKMLQAPNPGGMLETLKLMEDTIQKGSGTTFILPKDISMAGDISGVAIQIAQSLDNEEALGGVIEWQNVASKMARLFKYGLSKELKEKKDDSDAITRFKNLEVTASFKQWRPRNDTEYNNMLIAMKGAGLLSQKTGIEKNTESAPDEEIRVDKEAEKLAAQQVQAAQQSAEVINN